MVHEAPVYSPVNNKFYFSQLQAGFEGVFVVDLNVQPPTLGRVNSNPPIATPNGATFHNGS